MAQREVIIPPGMENLYENFHYAPAVRVDNTLYIAGQVGRDENLRVIEGTEAQFTQAFENLKKVLMAAGATLEDVVDLVTYHGGKDRMNRLSCEGRHLPRLGLRPER